MSTHYCSCFEDRHQKLLLSHIGPCAGRVLSKFILTKSPRPLIHRTANAQPCDVIVYTQRTNALH